MPKVELSPDAHARVAILFWLPDSNKLLAVSVKWILENGPPRWPETGELLKYEGTHITQ